MTIPGVVNGMYGTTTGMGTPLTQPIDDRQMSRLPVTNQPWPPPENAPVADAMKVWDAWWTGDRERLAWVYYNLGADSPAGRQFFSSTGERGLPSPRPGQFRGGLLGSVEYSFWGTPTPPGEKRTRSHVPIAGDIAQTSASLLFAKPPVLRSTLEGKQAAINNAYFEDLVDDHFHRRLSEAAELCSAHGGVYLRVVWDRDVRPKPWIVGVPADVAVPEFRYDVLRAVTFWQTLVDDGEQVIRHLEKHVPGSNSIQHGLYRGDQIDLGESIPLAMHPTTARFAADPAMGGGDTIYFPDQPLDASSVGYVPNLTPNRIWRDLGPQAWPLGRSDYQSVEGLMDNLDEAFSSWMRDIRLSKMRVFVPPEFLDNIGRGKGAVWDPERSVYSPLKMLLGENPPNNGIMANQFVIRWMEHQQTCLELVNKIVQQAGYSPQTFGDYAGNAPTATEINARERKTLLTRSKKITNWRPQLADIIYGQMTIEKIYFGNTLIVPERPEIEFIETVGPDITQLAGTASVLAEAEAASKQVLVQMVHPDWTPEQVNEEVQRIFSETGAMLAAHARVSLAAPMGATLESEVDALSELAPVPPVDTSVPGDEAGQPSTGDSNEVS